VVSHARKEDSAPRGRLSGVGPILIIEDDFAIRYTLAQVLSDEGFEVISAADGREALLVMAEHHARPGLIVLDLWMPAMSGLEFRAVQQSYARWSDIPVLVITASRVPPPELGNLGLNHVFRKPLDLDALVDKINLLTTL
jgi:CheY-like chemotaxis protein